VGNLGWYFSALTSNWSRDRLFAGLPEQEGRLTGLWRAGLALLGVIAGLVACSPPPPPPTVINITLSADKDVNPAANGQAAPLQVRIYQLSSDAAFSGAEFFQLFSQDQATLKSDLVKQDQYIVAPGGSKTATLNPSDNVTAIGIFAAYRDFAGAKWRAVVSVTPHQTTKVNIQAGAKGLTVKTEPASALKSGS
jgi:type VI secretion system protein VasD